MRRRNMLPATKRKYSTRTVVNKPSRMERVPANARYAKIAANRNDRTPARRSIRNLFGLLDLGSTKEASVIILFDGEKEVFDSIDFRERFISMPF